MFAQQVVHGDIGGHAVILMGCTDANALASAGGIDGLGVVLIRQINPVAERRQMRDAAVEPPVSAHRQRLNLAQQQNLRDFQLALGLILQWHGDAQPLYGAKNLPG